MCFLHNFVINNVFLFALSVFIDPITRPNLHGLPVVSSASKCQEYLRKLPASLDPESISEPVLSNSSEAAQRDSSEPAQNASSEPAQNDSLEPAQNASSEQAQNASSEPAQRDTLESVQNAASEPAQNAASEPAPNAASEPVQNAASEPAQNAASEPAQNDSLESAVPVNSTLQHCEVKHCTEEVFAACPHCLILMCYDHISVSSACVVHNSQLNGDTQDNDSEQTEEYEYVDSISSKKRRTTRQTGCRRAKELRLSGEEYTSCFKTKQGVLRTVQREKRILLPRCNHIQKQSVTKRSIRCGEISDETRQRIFDDFWKMKSWGERKMFVKMSVETRGAVRRRKVRMTAPSNKQRNKKDLRDCYMRNANKEKVKVCKKFILSTLCIGEDQYRRWTGEESELHVSLSNSTGKKKRGRLPGYRGRKGVEAWLEKLPKVPSHYCRASTTQVYVESTFRSYRHMHRVYREYTLSQDSSNTPVSRTLFKSILTRMRIRIHSPRKDQCDLCYSFKTGNTSEEDYRAHRVKKDEARDAKSKAIEE